MSAQYVRDYCGVPASRNMRVEVDGRPGEIVSFPGAYIGVRFDDDNHTHPCHPTWRVTYVTGNGRIETGD